MDALCDEDQLNDHEIIDEEEGGARHWFRFANNVLINASKFAEMVNVLDYVETDKNSDRHTWCRVTDIELTEETVQGSC